MLKHIHSIPQCPTSHGCGSKCVLLANDETQTNITQIAVTKLQKDEVVVEHVHDDMEEYFLVVEGILQITVGDDRTTCQKDDFIIVRPTEKHQLCALTDCTIMTIGCAIK